MDRQKTVMQIPSNYVAIDLAKLFFAYGIIGIHNGLLQEYVWGQYLHTVIFRLGVPFFFFCSGYFLSKKVTADNKKSVLISYCKNLLPPYLLLNMYYIPAVQIRGNYLSAGNMLSSLWYLFTGRSMTVMWFVGSLFWCALFLYFLFDGNKEHFKCIIALFFGIYCVGMIFNTHCYIIRETPLEFVYSWMTTTFRSNSNALFCGFLYFSMGFYIGKYGSPKILSTKGRQIQIFFIGLAGLLGESYIVIHNLAVVLNYEYYIFQVVVVPALFLLLINIPVRNSVNLKWIRKLSSYIYYIHMAVLYIIIDFIEKQLIIPAPNSLYKWIFTACITTVISMAYMYLRSFVSKKRKSSNIHIGICIKQKCKEFLLYNTALDCCVKIFLIFFSTILLHRWTFLLQLSTGKRIILFVFAFFIIMGCKCFFDQKSLGIAAMLSVGSAALALYYKVRIRFLLLDSIYLFEVLMESTLFFMIVFYCLCICKLNRNQNHPLNG